MSSTASSPVIPTTIASSPTMALTPTLRLAAPVTPGPGTPASGVPLIAPPHAALVRPGETGQGPGFAVTLHGSAAPVEPGRYDAPRAGFHLVGFDVTVANTGARPLATSLLDFTLQSLDFRATYSPANGAREPRFGEAELLPGVARRGWVTFWVADGASAGTLTYAPVYAPLDGIVFDLR